MMSDSDDNIPLALRPASFHPTPAAVTPTPPAERSSLPDVQPSMLPGLSSVIPDRQEAKDDDSSEDDLPLALKISRTASIPNGHSYSQKSGPSGKRRPQSNSPTVVKEESDSGSDSDVPLAKRVKSNIGVKAAPVKHKTVSPKRKLSSSTTSSVGQKRKAKSANHMTNGTSSSKGALSNAKREQSEEAGESGKDEEEEYQWWLEQNRDDSIKWKSLHHNGVVFPPPYEPHGVKMKYNGKEVELAPEAEEIASFYAALLGTDYAANPVFQRNFFKDFLAILKKTANPPPIKELSKCDFTPIYEHLENLKEIKKNMTKEEKQAIKEEKARADEKYNYCILDGRREKVGNFRMEPPGLFRGRGEHPKAGCLKKRIIPEQVTLNLSKDAPIPVPPAGHKWGGIIHNNSVGWLATWKENVTGNVKYMWLSDNSPLKGQSDFKKFEKARELKKHVERIRKIYTQELHDKVMATRQRATAMYLIDRLALRAGNEKGGDEADTVGCCSLRYEHVTLEESNKVVFDFLGKDSIRYHRDVYVDKPVWKNLNIFKKKPKKAGDMLFDRLTTSKLNAYLSELMPGLTAKVFRTFNASFTFQDELRKTPMKASMPEKILSYNRANRQVAVLCNHQRAVPKKHGDQMDRMQNKVRAIKYQRWHAKRELMQLQPKIKKKKPELVAPESDLDDDWCVEHEASMVAKEREKAEAKIERENEKLRESGEGKLSKEEEKQIREKANDLESQYRQERKTGVVEIRRGANPEKLEDVIEKLSLRINAAKTQLIDRDENKTTALGTSKINYLDPRLTAAWCKKHNVPLEKMFNTTLRKKFRWAMDVDGDWEF